MADINIAYRKALRFVDDQVLLLLFDFIRDGTSTMYFIVTIREMVFFNTVLMNINYLICRGLSLIRYKALNKHQSV